MGPGTVAPKGPMLVPTTTDPILAYVVPGERVGARQSSVAVLAIFSLSSSFRTAASQPSACSRSCGGSH